MLSQGVAVVVMKNWLPFVPGPAFAIASKPGRSNVWVETHSSLNGLPQNGFTPATGACGITALDHEISDDAVKENTIIVAVLDVGGEIFTGEWGDVVKEFKLDASLSGFNVYFRHTIRGLGCLGGYPSLF